MWTVLVNGRVFEHSGARIWYLRSGLPTSGTIKEKWQEGEFNVFITVEEA